MLTEVVAAVGTGVVGSIGTVVAVVRRRRRVTRDSLEVFVDATGINPVDAERAYDLLARRRTKPGPGGVEIPLSVCRECNNPIEYFNDVWWVVDTCLSVCDARHIDGTLREQHIAWDVEDDPPLHDREALERWLREG